MDAINKDANMKSPEEIVSAFVKHHAVYDKHITAARKAAIQMAKLAEEGVPLNMIPDPLEAKYFIDAHWELVGDTARGARKAAELHKIGTEHAFAAGVDDLGRPETVAGVKMPPKMTRDGGR